MMYAFFTKTLRRYIFIGTLTSVSILGALLLFSYSRSLEETIQSFSRVGINLRKMNTNMDTMDHVMTFIKKLYPQIDSLKRRDALLMAVDDLHTVIANADIVLQDIIQDGSELLLPADIVWQITRYDDLTNAVGHLQSMTFPYVTFERLVAEKQGQGGVITHIQVTMRLQLHMPAESSTPGEQMTEPGMGAPPGTEPPPPPPPPPA